MPNSLFPIKTPAGLIKDQSPYALLPSSLTESLDITYQNGSAEKMKGWKLFFEEIVLGAGLPKFALQAADRWFYVTGEATDSIKEILDKDSSTPLGNIIEKPTPPYKWNGAILQGATVFNSGGQPPHGMPGRAGAGVFSEIIGFDSVLDTVPTATTEIYGFIKSARLVRAFKNRLIFLNIQNDDITVVNGGSPNGEAVDQPYTVQWSEAADPGLLPTDLNYISALNTCGRTQLAEHDGEIVDAGTLRDSLIIYREKSVYSMDFIGGQYIFSFKNIFNDSEGILGQDCWCSIGSNKHFVISTKDMYVHDGYKKVSVADKAVQDYFFNKISSVEKKNVFCYSNQRTKEVFVVYPQDLPGIPSLRPNFNSKALVWNWDSGDWSERNMFETFSAAKGTTSTIDSALVGGGLWDNDAESWDSDSSVWNNPSETSADKILHLTVYGIYKDYEAYEKEWKLFRDSNLLRRSGYYSEIERIGIQLHENLGKSVQIKRVWPNISGKIGSTVDIYIGVEGDQDGTPTWSGPHSFIIGTDKKVDVRLSGRFGAYRVESENSDWFRVDGMDFEIDSRGKR